MDDSRTVEGNILSTLFSLREQLKNNQISPEQFSLSWDSIIQKQSV